jgi:hypothetical protein
LNRVAELFADAPSDLLAVLNSFSNAKTYRLSGKMSHPLSAVMAAHWIACEKLVLMISTLLQQTKSAVTRTNFSLAFIEILLETPVSFILRYDIRRMSHAADEIKLNQRRSNFSGPIVIKP